MASTTVSDYVIWTRHIHDDPELKQRVLAMWAGATIELVVDGVRGTWRKMEDGADGRPTPGIRPIGGAQVAWHALFRQRRGGVVSLIEVDLSSGVSETHGAERRAKLLFPPLGKTEEERAAALAALLDAARLGYRSDRPYGPRDELYDRE
jgi:hypothetical protein